MNSKGKPLHSKIFETLRDRIVYGKYPPGTNLSEKDLCEEFEVSRTPLREAFLKLEDMKLVDVIPRFGTRVTPIDIHEIRSAFEVKIKLEGLSGELAAGRIQAENLSELNRLIDRADQILTEGRHRRLIEFDNRFHQIIRQAAQNPVLQEFLDNLHYRCARLWSSSLSEIVPNEEIVEQLRSVHLALKAGDPKKARDVMEEHVQYFIDKIKRQLL
jgi:DNA-binding GntR family transcriptional regulator